jgi:hypothetical protein
LTRDAAESGTGYLLALRSVVGLRGIWVEGFILIPYSWVQWFMVGDFVVGCTQLAILTRIAIPPYQDTLFDGLLFATLSQGSILGQCG